MKKWNYNELVNQVKEGLDHFSNKGFVDPGEYAVVYDGDHWAPLSFCELHDGMITDPDWKRTFYPEDQCQSWFIVTNDELATLWAENPEPEEELPF